MASQLFRMSKIKVPEDLLADLKCTLCSNYLSHLPITSYPDMGLVCGRCPVMDNDFMKGRQEKAYQIISQLLLFPCRHMDQGCKAMFNPQSIQEHEESCHYREYICPRLPQSSCSWRGHLDELYGHYVDQHSDLALTEAGFSLDMFRSHVVNYLMEAEGRLFVVQAECSQNEEKFWCSARCTGSKSIAKRYSYQIQLVKSGEVEQRRLLRKEPVEDDFTMTLNRATATCVDVNAIGKMFDNPSDIRCKVRIIHTRDADDPSTQMDTSAFIQDEHPTAEQNSPEAKITGDIIHSLECPVCKNCMVPPIHLCLNGHSLCTSCRPEVQTCPSCRGDFANIRNYALEELTAHIPYFCKYQESGCDVTTTAEKIRDHELECRHGVYECPLNISACTWKGPIPKLMSHVHNSHEDMFYEMDNPLKIKYHVATATNGPQPFIVEESRRKIFQFEGNIFTFCHKKDTNLNASFDIKYVGPKSEAALFVYRLEVTNVANAALNMSITSICSTFTKDANEFENGFTFSKEVLKKFAAANGEIEFRCRVARA